MAPRSSSVPHRIATSPALWLTLIFSLLTVALTWPVARVLATGVPGDYGDPLFIAWVMSWVADKVTAALTNPLALRGFWDAPIFHPETGALAFSEHFIPQTVLILPVYWLTHNPILSYNIAFLTSYVLTGLGTALLTRALSRQPCRRAFWPASSPPSTSTASSGKWRTCRRCRSTGFRSSSTASIAISRRGDGGDWCSPPCRGRR